MADICERLSDACNGHPAAEIQWPHRLLHDAKDEIERLRALVEFFEKGGKPMGRVREELGI